MNKVSSEFRTIYANFVLNKTSGKELVPYLNSKSQERKFLLGVAKRNSSFLLGLDYSYKEYKLFGDPTSYDLKGNELQKPALYAYLHPEVVIIKTGSSPEQIQSILLDQLSHMDNVLVVTCYIEEVNFDEMVALKLIPLHFQNERLVSLYKDGFTDEEIEEALDVQEAKSKLDKAGLWSLITKEYAIQQASYGDSFSLLYTFPELLYKSMRPKTNMSMFQLPNSNMYSSVEDLPEKCVPVTRYALGMSKGKYYDERPDDVCGYFFYLEPESTTFLEYRESISAFNKTDLAKKFVEILNDGSSVNSHVRRLLRQLEPLLQKTNENLLKHISGDIPEDLRFELSTGKIVMNDLGLYAQEDEFDQPLCQTARYLGYDICIFTHMVGSYQVVSEILDTRDDYLNYLWFLK